MTRFRPRIREQDKGAVNAIVLKTLDQLAAILGPEPNILQTCVLNLTEKLGDPFEEDLTRQDADVRVFARLSADMLAAAESGN